MGRLRIATLGVGLALAIALTCGTALAKSPGGVDRSFGSRGTVDLRFLLGEGTFDSFRGMSTGPDRSIFVSDFETSCVGPSSCSQVLRVIRLYPDGTLDTSYGDGGSARIPSPPPWNATAAVAVDEFGRAVVAISQPGSVAVTRLTEDGRIDGAFGPAVLPCDCELGAAKLGFDRGGRILLAYLYQLPWFEGRTREMQALVARLTPAGALDTSYGNGGRADLRVPGYEWTSGIRGDGSVLIASALESPTAPNLIRVGANGRVDPGFARRFQRSLRDLGRGGLAPSGAVDLVPGPRGSMQVFASRTDFSHGFALRVRRNGALDSSFSGDGFRSLPVRVQAATAAGRGRTVVAGMGDAGFEVRVFNSAGRPYRPYGGGRPVLLSGWNEPAGLSIQGRRPLFFTGGYSFCRSYCPPKPKLLRLKALR